MGIQSPGGRIPDAPLFLVAHSMGSFAAQTVILDRPDLYDGVVLSGSTALDVLAAELSKAEGPVGLEAFNAGSSTGPGMSGCRATRQRSTRTFRRPLVRVRPARHRRAPTFAGAARLGDAATLKAIRSDLPIDIVSGDADPLAAGGAMVELLGQRYRDAGLTDVTVTLYPGARHEIFNETNRDAITADVVGWLEAHS